MFATIGRTWELFKMSWRVLMKDKELLWFPIMSFLAVAVIAGAFLAIAFATGSFDRLDATLNESRQAAAAAAWAWRTRCSARGTRPAVTAAPQCST